MLTSCTQTETIWGQCHLQFVTRCIFCHEQFVRSDCWCTFFKTSVHLPSTYYHCIYFYYKVAKIQIHKQMELKKCSLISQSIINKHDQKGGIVVFNATFNNISVISWRSVLLAEETGENCGPVASHWQTLSHNVVSSTPRLNVIRTYNFSGKALIAKVVVNPTIIQSQPRRSLIFKSSNHVLF